MTELSLPPTTKLLLSSDKSDWTTPRKPGTHLRLGVSLQDWTHLRKICQVAKDRCSNPRNAQYPNYGGRGINFVFGTGSDMAEWVFINLGLRPSKAHSVDRHDNDKGYEPGNLRWATRYEQGQNKRRYKAWKYGERARELCRLRPDLSYETIRTWINQGMSNVEILTRIKTTRGRPRVRRP